MKQPITIESLSEQLNQLQSFIVDKLAELENRTDELETYLDEDTAFYSAEGEIIDHGTASKMADDEFTKECDYLGANFTNESVRQYFKSGDDSDLVPLHGNLAAIRVAAAAALPINILTYGLVR